MILAHDHHESGQPAVGSGRSPRALSSPRQFLRAANEFLRERSTALRQRMPTINKAPVPVRYAMNGANVFGAGGAGVGPAAISEVM